MCLVERVTTEHRKHISGMKNFKCLDTPGGWWNSDCDGTDLLVYYFTLGGSLYYGYIAVVVYSDTHQTNIWAPVSLFHEHVELQFVLEQTKSTVRNSLLHLRILSQNVKFYQTHPSLQRIVYGLQRRPKHVRSLNTQQAFWLNIHASRSSVWTVMRCTQIPALNNNWSRIPPLQVIGQK